MDTQCPLTRPLPVTPPSASWWGDRPRRQTAQPLFMQVKSSLLGSASRSLAAPSLQCSTLECWKSQSGLMPSFPRTEGRSQMGVREARARNLELLVPSSAALLNYSKQRVRVALAARAA